MAEPGFQKAFFNTFRGGIFGKRIEPRHLLDGQP